MACYLGDHARLDPHKAAVVCAATGTTLRYGELDARSRRLARLLHGLGLRRGDRLAVLLENHIRFFEIAWAALRSGLLLTTVNRHLTADEAAFIVNDCDARVLISSAALQTLATDTAERLVQCPHRLMIDGIQRVDRLTLHRSWLPSTQRKSPHQRLLDVGFYVVQIKKLFASH